MELNLDFLPVSEPDLTGNEKKYLIQCIESGWISSDGPFVEKFEEGVAKVCRRDFATAVSSGTAALDIAIRTLDLKPGDEVIVPTFTIISCIHEIIRAGATPVFVDSCPDTWNMDVDQAVSKISNMTRAIIVVHTYGLTVELDALLKICKSKSIVVIEDAAQALGLSYRNKPCGSFGDISILSFYPNKYVTTGEGGMCLTNNPIYANRFRSLRNLCFNEQARFVHHEIGWNYRMTNLQAAVGLAQLERLTTTVAKKREIGLRYSALLEACDKFQLPLKESAGGKNGYWVFGLMLNRGPLVASDVMDALKKSGIGSRPFFCPLHRQPALDSVIDVEDCEFPVANNMYERGFYIPSGVTLSISQQRRVVDALLSVFK